MAQERDVTTKLTVKKEGDVGAFDETSEAIDRLHGRALDQNASLDKMAINLAHAEANAENAARGLRSLNVETDHAAALLENASRGAKEGGNQFGILGEKAKIGGASISTLAGNVTLAAGAFTAGWAAGTKFREMFPGLTAELDKYIQSSLVFQGYQATINALLGEGGDKASAHKNALNILAKNGIDTAGLSAAQLSTKLEEVMRKHQSGALEAGEHAAALEKFAASIGLSVTELNKQSESLAKDLAAFSAANAQLSKEDLGKLFGAQIKAVLDAYAQLKVEPPKAIAELAAQWGVLTSAGDLAVEANKAQVDQLRQQMGLAAQMTKEEGTKLAQSLVQALQGIDLKGLKFADPEQFEQVKTGVDEVVQKFRDAGLAIPEEVAEIATSVDIMVAGFEVGPPAAAALAASLQPVAAAADAVNTSLTGAGKGAEAAAAGVVTLTRDAETGQLTMTNLGAAAETAAVGIVRVETDAATGAKTITNLGAAAETAATGAGKLDTALDTEAGGEAFKEAATGAQDLGTALDDAATKAPTAGAALAAVEPTLTSLEAKLGSLASALTDLSQTEFGAAIAAQVQTAETAVDSLIAKVKAAQTEVTTLAETEAA